MEEYNNLPFIIGPQSGTKISYLEAWLYCLTLDHNGYKDWRMLAKGDAFSLAIENIDIYIGTWMKEADCEMNSAGESMYTHVRAHVIPVRDKND